MAQRFTREAIDALLALTRDLGAQALNWRPAPETNSLYALATHVVGSAEEALLNTLCAVRPSTRDRAAEFVTSGESTALLAERWRAICAELDAALERVTADDLERTFRLRRGDVSGHELLFVAATHAHEHLAAAELTRQLLDARDSEPREPAPRA